MIKPFGVIEVVDGNGRMVWRVKPQKKVALSRAGAAIMTNMLTGVIQEGTGKKAKVIGRPIAGKTGTTNEFKDALFIGFSPSIATGVWVGQDTPDTLGKRETGSKAALPIWIDFMSEALASRPYRHFDIPDDVVKANMDPLNGRLLPDDATNGVMALFKKGTEPKPF
jgi:penicillin-binding protein 1A